MAAGRRQVGYRWHLRRRMADHGMFNTTDLQPHLQARGIELSNVQVYRLVAQTPERLNLQVLAALCDVLGCSPAELIEPVLEEATATGRAAAGGDSGETRGNGPGRQGRRPRRARIVDGDT